MRIRNFLAAPVILAGLVAGSADAAEIIPHQAVYRLTLKDLNIDGWADTSSGIMEVNVSRDCFHFGYDRRIEFDIAYTDDRETRFVMEERRRESVGGQHFWFWSRTTLNGRTVSIITGEANRPEEGKVVVVKDEIVEAAKVGKEIEKEIEKQEGVADAETKEAVEEKAAAEEAAREAEEKAKAEKEKVVRYVGVQVRYSWPEVQQMEVPQNVVFPFTALAQQLDRLAKGELAPELPVFDGSNSDGAFRAIYRPAPATNVGRSPVPDGDAELLDTPAWRYSTQYILIGGDDPRPARTEIVKIHKNGIVSETTINFGLFSLDGTLAWVKGLDSPECK